MSVKVKLPADLVLAKIRAILDDDKIYQTDALKLGAIWGFSQKAGFKFIEHDNHIEVIHE